MDPSERDRRDVGSDASGDDRGPAYTNGWPPGGDGWLSSALESSSEAVKVVDPDGTLRYASPAFGRVFGYDPEEAVGTMNVLEYVHPDDLPRVLVETERAMADRKVVTNRVEYRFRHADGSWRWVEGVGTYLLDDPAVRGVVVQTRDVTDRKEAEEALRRSEEALRRSEERYRTLVEQIPAVTYIDLADGSFDSLYTSPQIEDLLGYTPEEWLEGKLWEKRLHPDDRERILAADERLEVHGEPFAEEYRLLARDGSVFWVREEAVLVRGGEAEPLFWQGVIFDLTERRNTEEALRRSEALLAESQRIAGLGTWEWDLATGEVWWSEETYRIHGLEPGEEADLQKKVEEAFFPEDLILYKEKIGAVLSGEAEGYDYEHRLRRAGGEVRWAHVQAEVFRGEGGEPLRMVGTVHDVSERRTLEERLRHQALHDPLTGLPNRSLLVDRLAHALEGTRRRGGGVAVLFMDLDEFKVVNDSLGHEAGDLLLTVVAQRLRRCLRREATLARFGGDEFVVLIEDVEDPGEAVKVAGRVMDELRRPFALEGRELHVSASVGISLGTARNKTPEDLLRDADTAMYRAKEEGGGFRVFDPEMHERVARRLDLENDLRRAVERGEFLLHYQPVFGFDDQGVWGTEALLRWDHPERGLLRPSEFVAVAEETGLIVPIGAWALEEACRRTKEWQDAYPRNPPLAVIVNLSARQLRHPGCERTIRAALERSGLAPEALSLDVTETAFISALEDNRSALERIQALGVRISIDDFGMGYSSLSYLKRLPADALKIDKSFLRGFGENAEDTALVRMIIDVGHTLGMRVIAEGVEKWTQAALLSETGCDMAQGYHFSGPVPPEELPRFLGAS